MITRRILILSIYLTNEPCYYIHTDDVSDLSDVSKDRFYQLHAD
jgi:hypothetical protein